MFMRARILAPGAGRINRKSAAAVGPRALCRVRRAVARARTTTPERDALARDPRRHGPRRRSPADRRACEGKPAACAPSVLSCRVEVEYLLAAASGSERDGLELGATRSPPAG